jgi:hypothetical protein
MLEVNNANGLQVPIQLKVEKKEIINNKKHFRCFRTSVTFGSFNSTFVNGTLAVKNFTNSEILKN